MVQYIICTIKFFLLFCFRVGKEIAARDPVPQDVNLNSVNLYVLWGIRVNDSQPGMLLTHGADVPERSLEQISPTGIVLDIPVSCHNLASLSCWGGGGGGGS